jgi:hypothetical protein
MLSNFPSWGGWLAISSVCWGAGAALAHAADVVQSTGSFSAGVSPSSKDASNTLRVYCDGDRYGRNLNVGSCRSVFDHWGTDEAQTRFAQRHSGVPYDLPLPYRLYSGEWVGVLRCTFPWGKGWGVEDGGCLLGLVFC